MADTNDIPPWSDSSPPGNISAAARAVQLGLRGEWKQAHAIVQNENDADAAWVHAWLHRIEGDIANAAYWYCKAGRSMTTGDMIAEGQAIAQALRAG